MHLPGRYAALGLLSASSLLLEITLTRLFAVLYYPPSVFLVLTLAIVGIGLGAALATWRPAWRSPQRLSLYLALASCLTASLPLTIGFTFTQIALPVVLVALPYILVGITLVTFFSSDVQASSRLYMADLMGAGLGAVAAIPLMDSVNPLNSLWLAAVGMALAALIAHPTNRPVIPAIALIGVTLVLGTNLATNWFQMDAALARTEKPLAEALRNGGQIVASHWGSFARTDVVLSGEDQPLRMYMDGAAGSLMPAPFHQNLILQDIGFFPFATARPNRVMVIGPGGGLDVAFGRQSGAQSIVAVEVNPGSVQLVESLSEYNNDLYGAASVRIIIDEGRSVLRREDQPYDLISLSQVVTLAAERSGYALTENTIYTTEAFNDYLDHLTPDGQIALKLYDEITLTRALATALAALNQRGLSDQEALQHVAAYLDTRANPPIPLLMVRSTAYDREELVIDGAIAREVGFTPLYLPGVLAQSPLDAVEAGERPFAEIIAESEEDISPTTDNQPFFFQFDRGIPETLNIPLVSIGVLTIAGFVLLIIFHPRRVLPASWRSHGYFAGLGIGFMTVEIAIIQQVRLFLGHPTLAVTVVLAVLLIGGGIGSRLSERWTAPRRSIALAIVGVLIVWIAIWPLLSQQFRSAPSSARILVVVISLLPLAGLMGMPFPLGLRATAQEGDQMIALAWAINGVMTVAGTVLAMTLALVAGFNSVLFLGALSYTSVAIMARYAVPRTAAA
jgi:hypothetical protein